MYNYHNHMMPEPLRPLLLYGWQPARSSFTLLNDRWLFANWWVIACCIFAYACYEGSASQFRRDYTTLSQQLKQLEKEKSLLLEQQSNLKKEINSQNDPAWVELTLMRELGKTPKDQKKIYFSKTGER